MSPFVVINLQVNLHQNDHNVFYVGFQWLGIAVRPVELNAAEADIS